MYVRFQTRSVFALSYADALVAAARVCRHHPYTMSRSQSSQWSGAADHDERNDESDASEHNDWGVAENATAHAYEVLGISHNASTKEIAKAYKDLARKNHPDKSSSPHASEKFKQIKEAYDTLIPMQANMEAAYISHVRSGLPWAEMA